MEAGGRPGLSLEELLGACLEAPPDERPSKLEQVCSTHPELADQLRAMYAQLEHLGFLVDSGTGSAPAADAWRLPDRLGSFRLEEVIGRGGMGVVWRARQTSLGDRLVALKMIRPDLVGHANAKLRFVREARLASRLDHPNVCGVLEVGQTEGIAWLAMPFVEGRSLRTLLDEARASRSPHGRGLPRLDPDRETTLDELLSAFIALARGLSHAHARGLVHRDVKPGNILVQQNGELVLLDFGLARDLEEATVLTLSQDLVGTPAYMAPEQAARRTDVDARADVYGLGATLFECITHELPHPAPSREQMLRRIQRDAAPDPRRLAPWLPRAVAAVLEGALQPDRDRRYDSADAFADDLQRALDHRPVHVRRPTLLQRGAFWVRRNPWPAILVGVLAIAALVSARFAVTAAEQARLFEAGDLVGRSVTASNYDDVRALEDAYAAVVTDDDPRTRDQLHRAMRRMRLVAKTTIDVRPSVAAAFLDGGERIGFVSRGVAAVLDRTGRILDRTETSETVEALAFDGDDGPVFLLADEDGAIRRWRPGSALEELSGPRARSRPGVATFTCATRDAAHGLAWFGDAWGHLYRVEDANGDVEEPWPTPDGPGYVVACGVLPDGGVAWGLKSNARARVLARRGDRVFGPFETNGLSGLVTVPGTGSLWLAIQPFTLRRLDLASGTTFDIEVSTSVTAMACDRNLLWAGCLGGDAYCVRNGNPNDRAVFRRCHTGLVGPIAVDAATVATCGGDDKTVRLFTRNGDSSGPPLYGVDRYVMSVALDPRQQLVAAATLTGTLCLWRQRDPTPSLVNENGPYAGHFAFDGEHGVLIGTNGASALRGDPETARLTRLGDPPFPGGGWAQLATRSDLFARADDSGLSVHDAATGQLLAATRLKKASCGVAFLDDDHIWVAINGGPLTPPRIQTWRFVRSELRLELLLEVAIPDTWQESRYFWARVTLSCDGSIVAAACRDGTVRVYTASGDPIGTPLHHSDANVAKEIFHVAISGDDRRIVSSCVDGTVKSWLRRDDGTYAFEGLVTTLPPGIIDVAFDADSKRIACGSDSGNLQVFDIDGDRRPLEDFRIGTGVRCCRFWPGRNRISATTIDGRFLTWFLDHDELRQRARALLPRR